MGSFWPKSQRVTVIEGSGDRRSISRLRRGLFGFVRPIPQRPASAAHWFQEVFPSSWRFVASNSRIAGSRRDMRASLSGGSLPPAPALPFSSLCVGCGACGAAPFCGPGSMQFLRLFEFGVRTRSASSYRARYVVCRCCSDTSILQAGRQRLPSTGTMMR